MALISLKALVFSFSPTSLILVKEFCWFLFQHHPFPHSCGNSISLFAEVLVLVKLPIKEESTWHNLKSNTQNPFENILIQEWAGKPTRVNQSFSVHFMKGCWNIVSLGLSEASHPWRKRQIDMHTQREREREKSSKISTAKSSGWREGERFNELIYVPWLGYVSTQVVAHVFFLSKFKFVFSNL